MIRKLSALGFFMPPKFDIQDESSRRRLVSWLEDQIIRHLPIEDRCGLRNVDSNEFIPCINDYLSSIECPWTWNQSIECIDWLVNFALRLQYEDAEGDGEPEEEEEEEAEASKLNQQSTATGTDAADGGKSENDASIRCLLSLDWSSDDVTQAVDKLAESLNIACHPDRQVTLEALLRLLEKKKLLQLMEKEKQCENQSTNQQSRKLMKGPGYTLHTAKLTNSERVGNVKCDQDSQVITAEKVLRLVHLNQLRSLQNVVNDLTVSAQAITAKPTTNAALATKSEGKKIK